VVSTGHQAVVVADWIWSSPLESKWDGSLALQGAPPANSGLCAALCLNSGSISLPHLLVVPMRLLHHFLE
jgi:hypothetical protein